MNAKRNLIVAIVLAVSVIVILTIALVSTGKKNKGSSQASAVTSDPMHQNQTDSTVFDGLAGKPAPDFTLTSYDGKKVSLKDFRGQKVLIFFNEGLMCYPACWNQIVAFGKDTTFKNKNTVILNITVDSKDDWKKAIDKMPELANNTVLLDTDRTAANLYGVMSLPSSMHPGQLPGHTFILIDKDGIVRYTYDDPQMAVRNSELITQVDKF